MIRAEIGDEISHALLALEASAEPGMQLVRGDDLRPFYPVARSNGYGYHCLATWVVYGKGGTLNFASFNVAFLRDWLEVDLVETAKRSAQARLAAATMLRPTMMKLGSALSTDKQRRADACEAVTSAIARFVGNGALQSDRANIVAALATFMAECRL